MTIDEYEKIFNKRAGDYVRVYSFTVHTLRAAIQDPGDKPLYDTAVMLLRLQADYSLDNKLFWFAYGYMRFRVRYPKFCDSDGDTAFVIKSGVSDLLAGFYSKSMPLETCFSDHIQAAQHIIAQLIINGHCNDA